MNRDSATSATETITEEPAARRDATSIRARFWRVMEGPGTRPTSSAPDDEAAVTD